MNKELKPCPFCGGTAELQNSGTLMKSFVRCTECGAESQRVEISPFYASNDEAIRAWNLRVDARENVKTGRILRVK